MRLACEDPRVAPITFAHRGARISAPENTIAAFRLALDQGSSGLETDAWLSSDQVVVLAHDPVVRSGLRRRRIADTTAADLTRFDVPRLSDLYAEIGTDYELSIDLKDPATGAAIIETARRFHASDRLWLCSPDLDVAKSLLGFREIHVVHSTRKDELAESIERHAADLGSSGVHAMNMHFTDWTAGLVSMFHRFDVHAFAWDAQEVRHLREMARIGIDAVYCDRPDRMVATIAEWSISGDG